MQEIFKKRGSLFTTTHLRSILSIHRSSQKAVDYVLDPSDPNQANREMIQYHLVVYLTALQVLVKQRFNNCDAIEIQISPMDVINL